MIRPFPEAAIIAALRGKKNVIILERTDEGLAGDNPLARDIRTALGKALEVTKFGGELPVLRRNKPRAFSVAHTESAPAIFAPNTFWAPTNTPPANHRKDGKTAADGRLILCSVSIIPTPSFRRIAVVLPNKAIAVRFHSIGGWGMITTGKNLGMIIGDFGNLLFSGSNRL